MVDERIDFEIALEIYADIHSRVRHRRRSMKNQLLELPKARMTVVAKQTRFIVFPH